MSSLITCLNLQEISDMYYNDYFNYAIKPLIISGYVEAKFIKIKDICLMEKDNQDIWEQNPKNPYLNDDNYKFDKLGKSILNIGMQFPVFVFPCNTVNGKYYVYEGRHRIASLKSLQYNKIIDDSHEVFCIISHKLLSDSFCEHLPLNSSIIYRTLYNPIFHTTRERLQETADGFRLMINMKNGITINNYTVQYEAVFIDEIIKAVFKYHFPLTRLIYFTNNIVKPNPVINDKLEFYNWINEPQG